MITRLNNFARKVPGLASTKRLARFVTILKEKEVSVERSLRMKSLLEDPHHQQVLIVGGGLSGSTMINRLTTNGGFDASRVTIIDHQPQTIIREGLDLLPYDMMEEADLKSPILGRIGLHTKMIFEEVIHCDPKNRTLGMFDGSIASYDYLLLCPGLSPNLNLPGLEGALEDKFAFVVSTINLENSRKFKERLENTAGREIIVYSSGTKGLDFSRPVNHALLLRDRFPKAIVRFVHSGNSISGDSSLDQILTQLLSDHKIHVQPKTVLSRIVDEVTAVFEREEGERTTETANFDLMYVEPEYQEPRWLRDAGIMRTDFDTVSCQGIARHEMFAFGSFLMPNNTIEGMLEQSFSCTGNLALQMLCDHDIKHDFNRESQGTGYQKFRLFPSRSYSQSLIRSKQEGQWKFDLQPKSTLDFYKFAAYRYTKLFKHTANGKDFGRIGYHMPKMTSGSNVIKKTRIPTITTTKELPVQYEIPSKLYEYI